MGYWLVRNRPDPPEPEEPERSLHLSRALDDRWLLNGSLDAEGGSVIATALRLATPDKTDVLTSPATRRANALVDICRFFLDHQQTHAGGRHRPHVNVVVELKDLEAGRGGQVVDGPTLDGATVSRLFCDSAVHRVVMSGRSAILDYGTATRTIPAPLWNALVIRDEHCRFPGCDRPSVWCEGHHVVWVTQGGPTDWRTWCCSAHAIITSSISPAGTPSSVPMPSSKSPMPTGSFEKRHPHAPKCRGDRSPSTGTATGSAPARLACCTPRARSSTASTAAARPAERGDLRRAGPAS